MSIAKFNFNDLPCDIKNKIFIINRTYNSKKNITTKVTGIVYSCLIDYSYQNNDTRNYQNNRFFCGFKNNVFNFDIKKHITKEQIKKYNIKNLICEKVN